MLYDYTTVERLFGTFVADHFEMIVIVAAIIVFIVVQYCFGDNRIHQKKEDPEIRNGWAYNESARMWVAPEQLDAEKNRRAYEENRRHWEAYQRYEAELEIRREQRRKTPAAENERTWYPTGWTLDTDTGIWEPPDYISLESDERWRWDPEKRIWIDKQKETANRALAKAERDRREIQMAAGIVPSEPDDIVTPEEWAQARKIHEREKANKQPSFEEWKAARQKEREQEHKER